MTPPLVLDAVSLHGGLSEDSRMTKIGVIWLAASVGLLSKEAPIEYAHKLLFGRYHVIMSQHKAMLYERWTFHAVGEGLFQRPAAD